MGRYRAGGRSTATAATASHCAAVLWNPSSAVPIYVREVKVVSTTAGVSNLGLQRCTSAGTTPASTVTPDIDNDEDKALAPPSTAVLYLGAYSSTQPVLLTPDMERFNLPANIGAAMIWVFRIKVPPSNGLAIYTPTAVVLPASDISFAWEE